MAELVLVGARGREAAAVEAVLGADPGDARRALPDADARLALDVLALLLEEGVERLAQLAEPEPVVGELGLLLREPLLEEHELAREHELLEGALGAVEHGRRGLLRRLRQRAGLRTLMMTCFNWPSPWLSEATSS